MITALLLFKDGSYKLHARQEHKPPEFIYLVGYSLPPPEVLPRARAMRDYALHEIKMKLTAEVKPSVRGEGPTFLYTEED